MINKANIAHFIAFVCCLVGYIWPQPIVFNIGVFALAGSVTNALAIHMLFEKVPGLYGSGVIANRFQEFKQGIYDLVMQQFFKPENLARFFNEHQVEFVHFDDIIDEVDISSSFDAFTEVVLDSQFGSMLNMFGGPKVLESFREPFINKLKVEVKNIAHGETFQEAVQAKMRSAMDTDTVHAKVSGIIEARLDELTPTMVKDIVSDMIRKHLGWLVVWGAVFGGLIGGAVALIKIP